MMDEEFDYVEDEFEDEEDEPENDKYGTYTFGTDPEIFMVNEGKLIPAFEVLEKHPEWRQGNHQTYKAFWDGFQAELNFRHGVNCLAYAGDDIRDGLIYLRKKLREKYPNGKLTIQNTFSIKEYLGKVEPGYLELGCAPSKNAYGDKPINPYMAKKIDQRWAGGHLIFGSDDKILKPHEIAKKFDLLLGIWAVGVAASIDNPNRRMFYGRAGEFRDKVLPAVTEYHQSVYTFEYRTLSNFWMCHPAISQLVFEFGRYIMNHLNDKKMLWVEPVATDDMVKEIINKCDVIEARKFVEKHKIFYLNMFTRMFYDKPWIGRKAVELSLNGVEFLVKNPLDVEGNWELDWAGYQGHSDHDYARFSGFATNGHLKSFDCQLNKEKV